MFKNLFAKSFMVLTLAILLILSTSCGYSANNSAPPAAAPAPAPAPAPAESSAAPENTADYSALPDVKIKFASWLADEHPQIVALNGFKNELAEKSGGKIVVEIYGSNQLGNEETYIDSVKQGTVEMCATGTMIGRDIPLVNVADMPFLFTDWEHAQGTLGGEIGKKITQDMPEKIGVRTVAWTVNGFRELSTNKLVDSIDDFNGLRIRVPNTPAFLKTFTALGINPIAMPFNEVFTALEQKVADGQDNPYAIVRSSHFYEVQSHILETRHMFSPVLWLINENFYQGLPEEFRVMFDEAIQNAADENWRLSIEADEADKAALIASGMTVTIPDEAFVQALLDSQINGGVYDWFYSEYPGAKEIEQEIRAWKK